MYHILVVDDEAKIREIIKKYAIFEGYRVTEAANGMEAIDLCRTERFDLIIMDVMMPELDGFSACREIRKRDRTPILMLSARGEEYDRIHGFELGIDDYVVKPFSPKELMMRVGALLKRSVAAPAAVSDQVSIGDLVVDFNKHQALVRGINVRLTLSEFRIVALLAKYAGKVLTYDFIIKELWGPRAGGDNQILRVNMANIRRKIEKNPAEPEYLFTEVGVGYRLAEGE